MKAEFNKADIQKTVDEFLQKKEKEIHFILDYEGRDFVKRCKLGGSYHNRTGNLRASIGYLVVKDGQVMSLHTEGGKEVGQQAGLTYGQELAQEYNKGWVLIVFAGMHYAFYVELKSYSVITSFLPGYEEFVQTLAEYIHE